MKILAFGVPRSGTTYAAAVLRNALGLQVGTEKIHKDGGVGARFAADASLSHRRFALGWRPPIDSFEIVVWIVRHPLSVISSLEHNFAKNAFLGLIAYYDPWYRIIWRSYREFSTQPNHCLTNLCAAAWVAWNDQCAERVCGRDFIRAQIERRDWICDVADRLDIVANFGRIEALITRNINHRRSHTPPTWEQLSESINPSVFNRVKEQAETYGYVDN